MTTLGRVSPEDVAVASGTHPLVIDGVERHVSGAALGVLRRAIQAVDRGEVVEVQTVPELLTTSEVARMLRVSRPTVVAMLERGDLPFERPASSHRLVRRQAVDDFLASTGGARRRHLDDFHDTYDPEHDSPGPVSTR